MFRLRRPTPEQLARWKAEAAHEVFAYEPVGATRERRVPRGYVATSGRAELGRGLGTFESARESLRDWRFFPTASWIRLVPERPEVTKGSIACIVTRQLGLSTVNFDRIVYVIDEPRRYAFAYGTLRHHVERGEEVFCVEHHDDDSVTFEIFSYSRPGHWLAWLGYPVTRSFQRRFIRDSLARMRASIEL